MFQPGLTSAGVSGQVNSGSVKGQLMPGEMNVNGEQILQNEAQQGINQLQNQGMDAVNNILSATDPSRIAAMQSSNIASVNAASNAGAANHQSALDQYGVELSPAQQRAISSMRGLRGASVRAAAANGTADQMYETRMAAVNDLSNVGTQIRQQGIAGLQQATNVSQSIQQQNDQLQAQHNSGIGGLIGMGIGSLGGPVGAAIGGAAAGAIF